MVQVKGTPADMDLLTAMAEAGQIGPRIDRTFAFAEIPAAVAYLETMRARGKVVVAL